MGDQLLARDRLNKLDGKLVHAVIHNTDYNPGFPNYFNLYIAEIDKFVQVEVVDTWDGS